MPFGEGAELFNSSAGNATEAGSIFLQNSPPADLIHGFCFDLPPSSGKSSRDTFGLALIPIEDVLNSSTFGLQLGDGATCLAPHFLVRSAGADVGRGELAHVRRRRTP